MRGCDFAWGVPPGRERELARALKRAGFRFVVRYLSQDASKRITSAEVQAYRAEGLHIVTVYEDAAAALLGGEPAGQGMALAARQQLAAAGAPEHAPVYFAADFQVAESQLPQVDAALDATAFVLTEDRNGIYGSYAAVTQAKHVHYKWQTAAWSAGQWSATAEIDQIVASGTILGVQWDLDESKTPDFGQWVWPHEPAPAPPKPPRVRKHRIRKGTGKAVGVAKGGAKKEPVLTASAAASLLTALLGFLQHRGTLHLDPAQVKVLVTTLVALAGVVSAATTTPARVAGILAAGGTAATALFGLLYGAPALTGTVPFAALAAGTLVSLRVSPRPPKAPPAPPVQ